MDRYYELLNVFPGRLKSLLEEKHMTGVELGKIVDVRQPNVSSWTCGYSLPRIDKLYLIAEHFNVSADWLLGLSNERTRK